MSQPDDCSFQTSGMRAYAPSSPEANPGLARLINAKAAAAAAASAYREALKAAGTLAESAANFVQIVTHIAGRTECSVAGQFKGCGDDSERPQAPCKVLLELWGKRREAFEISVDATGIEVWQVTKLYPQPVRASRMPGIETAISSVDHSRRFLLGARNELRKTLMSLVGTPVHLVNFESQGNYEGGPVVPSVWGWITQVDLDNSGYRIRRVFLDGNKFYPKNGNNPHLIPVTRINPIGVNA